VNHSNKDILTKRCKRSAISFMTLNTIPLIYQGLLISFVSPVYAYLIYKELRRVFLK